LEQSVILNLCSTKLFAFFMSISEYMPKIHLVCQRNETLLFSLTKAVIKQLNCGSLLGHQLY